MGHVVIKDEVAKQERLAEAEEGGALLAAPVLQEGVSRKGPDGAGDHCLVGQRLARRSATGLAGEARQPHVDGEGHDSESCGPFVFGGGGVLWHVQDGHAGWSGPQMLEAIQMLTL